MSLWLCMLYSSHVLMAYGSIVCLYIPSVNIYDITPTLWVFQKCQWFATVTQLVNSFFQCGTFWCWAWANASCSTLSCVSYVFQHITANICQTNVEYSRYQNQSLLYMDFHLVFLNISILFQNQRDVFCHHRLWNKLIWMRILIVKDSLSLIFLVSVIESTSFNHD